MKKLLVLVPVVLFLISCGGGEKDYWPIAVGNVWNYQTIATITTPDTTMTDSSTMKIEVTRETTLDNNTAVFEIVSSGEDYADTSYWQKTDNYFFWYDNKAETEPDTILTLPIEEGDSWTVHKDSSYTETIRITGKESVTVPAGTYDDCWKAMDIYTYGTMAETSYIWLAPDVGWIKMTTTEADSDFTAEIKIELTNATIK
ncbi:MAG: hypothetical protein ABIL22_09090 [candidate division WOR-3 bacterium]